MARSALLDKTRKYLAGCARAGRMPDESTLAQHIADLRPHYANEKELSAGVYALAKQCAAGLTLEDQSAWLIVVQSSGRISKTLLARRPPPASRAQRWFGSRLVITLLVLLVLTILNYLKYGR
jgi:hypothetical protein